MIHITTVFTPGDAPGVTTGRTSPPQPPAEIITQLHTELRSVGLPVAGPETGATPRFGPATSAQIKAFQQRLKLSVDGNLTPETGALVSLTALVATESDRSKLQAGLQGAANAVPDSPQYNYWLARYAITAGDYSLAARASARFAGQSGVRTDLGGILTQGGGTPQAPEVPFPENFYSYQFNLMAQSDIDELRSVHS